MLIISQLQLFGVISFIYYPPVFLIIVNGHAMDDIEITLIFIVLYFQASFTTANEESD